MLTPGQFAVLVVAVFWAVLVTFLVIVLLRLARLIGETTRLVRDVGERGETLLAAASATVERTNTQLAKTDAITTNVAQLTAQANAITTSVHAVVGRPLIRLAGLSHGVRRAVRMRRARTGRPARRQLAAPARGRR